jgi:hypothetical protein
MQRFLRDGEFAGQHVHIWLCASDTHKLPMLGANRDANQSLKTRAQLTE